MPLAAHGYAATACALDLAEAHLAEGDNVAAAKVTGLLFPVFGALRHQPGGMAALRLFCRVLRRWLEASGMA